MGSSRCRSGRGALLAALRLCTPVAGDPLADGWFTTSREEVLEEEALAVTGNLPTWLRGDYMQQSASVYEEPARNFTHTFDGFGKVLRWRFPGGGAAPTLRARMLQSNFWQRSEAAGGIVPGALFGPTAPPYTDAERLKSLTDNCTDNFNVNLHDFGAAGRRVAVTDSVADGARIDAGDLSSTRLTWDDAWTSKLYDRMSPAHPRRVPDGTGDTVTLVERINPTATTGVGQHSLIVYRVDAATGARGVLRTIKTKHMPYVHSIAVTARYAVVCAGPLRWEIPTMMEGGAASDGFRWGPENRSAVHLVPLDPASPEPVRTYDAEPFFGFHHGNAWETAAGGVAFDIVAHPGLSAAAPSPVAALDLATQRSRAARDARPVPTELRRYTLPAGGGAASFEALALVDAGGKQSATTEMPTYNTALTGARSCFLYMLAVGPSGTTPSDYGLVKKDTCREGDPLRVWYNARYFPAEAHFVAAPGGAAEDDGVLLAAAHDGTARATVLMILNASTMETMATLRRRQGEGHLMGYPIHAQFFPPDTYTCARGRCVPLPGGGGVPRAECDGACAPPPGERYQCIANQCAASANGSSLAACEAICGAPAPGPTGDLYRCEDNECVPASPGVPLASCHGVCRAPTPPARRCFGVKCAQCAEQYLIQLVEELERCDTFRIEKCVLGAFGLMEQLLRDVAGCMLPAAGRAALRRSAAARRLRALAASTGDARVARVARGI